MWLLYAIGSAVFAALTSILAKIGIDGVNSNLATAISKKSWAFLILSGLATGASWLCYYRAIQIGEVSKVVPVDKLSVVITLVLAFLFLHEQFTWKLGIGTLLITAGTLIMVWP